MMIPIPCHNLPKEVAPDISKTYYLVKGTSIKKITDAWSRYRTEMEIGDTPLEIAKLPSGQYLVYSEPLEASCFAHYFNYELQSCQ